MVKTHKTITILDKMTPCDKERFWSKVDVNSSDGCWEWKDKVNKDGYGQISVGGRKDQHKLRAHRVAKTLAEGVEIEEDKLVMHGCDNPPCCNPSHLIVADHQENMDDMVKKDRAATSFGFAKLNWEIVGDIRLSNLSGKELSNNYNVSQSTISFVRNHKTWKEANKNTAILP